MLVASTKAVLGDRRAQATGEEPSEGLRVDIVVQGANLELDPLLGPMVQETYAVANRTASGRSSAEARREIVAASRAGTRELSSTTVITVSVADTCRHWDSGGT
jgi:hypothetical protein